MPKLSSLPKATLVSTLEVLAESNEEVRIAVARLTEDPADRVKAIKKEIASFRRRKKFVPYYQQRPYYKKLELIATAIKEDIKDPAVGVKLALLAYALDEKLPYIFDGSDGAIGMWADGDLKPAFVHHAQQYPDRQKLLKLLVPFVNDCGYGVRQNIWEDAHLFLQPEEIDQLLNIKEGGENNLPVVKPIYRKMLVKATGDPDRFRKVLEEGDLSMRPDERFELAEVYLRANRPEDAVALLNSLVKGSDPYARRAREMAFDAYAKTGQQHEVNNIVDIWLQETQTVDGLEALIKKVGEDHRERLQIVFRERLENDKHPRCLTVLAFLDLGEEARAIQTFHRIELDSAFRSSLKELVKRLPTPEYALEVSLCLRRMVDETLNYGNSKYYKTAANRLKKAEALAREVGSFAQYATHADWVAGLRKGHGRKKGFWGLV